MLHLAAAFCFAPNTVDPVAKIKQINQNENNSKHNEEQYKDTTEINFSPSTKKVKPDAKLNNEGQDIKIGWD